MTIKFRLERLEKMASVDTKEYPSYVVVDSLEELESLELDRPCKVYVASYDENGVCVWRGPDTWDDDDDDEAEP